MASTKISADIAAPPALVFDLVSDPARFPKWDVTYAEATAIRRDLGREPTFEARRDLINREMHLFCRVVRAEPATVFAFVCDGGNGEMIHETFELSPAEKGGTRFGRELDFALPGQDLGVVAETTFAEAQVERSVEQAFARLNALLGASGDTGARPAPDEAETRSEDSGTISGQEEYSAHARPGSVPNPNRPT